MAEIIVQYDAAWTRLTGEKIQKIQTDGGGEFTANKLSKYFKKEGITQHTMAPESSEQNGIVECMHSTLWGRAHAMMIDANLPDYLWAEVIVAAGYLKEFTPMVALGGKTPYESWHGHAPDLSKL